MGFFIVDNDFNRGWIDAWNGKQPKDTSEDYINGYKHGKTGKY